MFDKTYNTYDNSIDFPDEINVNHNYAPTTKQIKLLREMEKEVKESVLDLVKIQDNKLNFNFFIRCNNDCFNQYEYVVIYTLNGEERKVTHTFETAWQSPKEALKAVFDKMSNDVVNCCISKNAEKIMNSLSKVFSTKQFK